jgi:oligopeptide/dipeptide ABC transporter ATP-binding protein
MSLLTFKAVERHFPVTKGVLRRKAFAYVRAVDGVSFEVEPGKTFALVGESGCGKTTIAKLALRLDAPTGGEISFQGRNAFAMSADEQREFRANVQAVFQDPTSSLNPRHRVSTIVTEPLVINREVATDAARAAATDALREVGLPENAIDRFPHEFSGGQRQRIAIARALVLKPSLIVLDEAVSALDVSIQAQVMNLLQDLQLKHHLAYLFIAHNLGIVRQASDRVGVMYLGRIVEQGPTEQVFSRRAHPYTRALIGASLPPDPVAARAAAIIQGEVPSAIALPKGCRFASRCPMAADICREIDPPEKQVGEAHVAACHFA